MTPANLPGLVIDGFENPFAPYAVIRARPAESPVLRLEKIDSVAWMLIQATESIFSSRRTGLSAGRARITAYGAKGFSKPSITRPGRFAGVMNWARTVQTPAC